MSGSQSLTRIIALLRVVANAPEGGIRSSDAAIACGLHQATTNRLIRSMLAEGLLRQLSGKRYALGPEIWALGNAARRSFDIRSLARSSMECLAESPGDVSFLQVRSGQWAVCIDRIDGCYPIRPLTLQAGDRRPLGVGAGSLALLAALPDKEVETVIETRTALTDFPSFTDDFLRGAVRETREQGFSQIRGDVVEEVYAFGAAIFDAEGNAIAALSCAAIKSRMSKEREAKAISALIKETQAISRIFCPVKYGRGKEPQALLTSPSVFNDEVSKRQDTDSMYP